MKVAKIKKVDKKQKNVVEEEKYSVKSFLIILLVLSITFGLFYFITYLVVKDQNKNSNTGTVVANSNEILLSQMLNRSEDEYYVLAIKSKSTSTGYSSINYQALYDKYIKDYSSSEEALKFYYVDLNSSMNESFIGENLVIKTDLTDMKLNDDVLFKVKGSKIQLYKVGYENIIDYLSKL